MLFSEISYKQRDAAKAMSIGWELVLTGHGDSGSQAPESGSRDHMVGFMAKETGSD